MSTLLEQTGVTLPPPKCKIIPIPNRYPSTTSILKWNGSSWAPQISPSFSTESKTQGKQEGAFSPVALDLADLYTFAFNVEKWNF